MTHIGKSFMILVLMLIPLSVADAHPGRTDANGGHTCRTNCTKWGLQYGQYHYHNGGGTSAHGGSSNAAVKKPSPKPQAPVVQKKTIVAVEKANVLPYPYSSEVASTLWYGYEIKAQGSLFDEYVVIDQGYVHKNVLTQYVVSKPKTVRIAVPKAYFFSTPTATSKVRGSANQHAVVHVVGESNGFYYGSTTDAAGRVLVGFVAKTVVK